MFAIFEDGSRQYRVESGTKVLVDYRDGLEPDTSVVFDRILLAHNGTDSRIGAPLVDGATVTATVLRPELKGEKLEIGKFKRRKNSRRHVGHRQKHTLVQIQEISIPGLEATEGQAEEEPAAV